MPTVLAPPPPTQVVAPRAVSRRQSLPGGRAVVGGFLVAFAVVAIFAAYQRAAAGPEVRLVVASNDLEIGERIERGDLALVPVQISGSTTTSRTFTDPSRLVGATVVGPVARGELVQASDVVRREGGADTAEVSLAVPASKAVGGSLVRGELVDVLATYGSGVDAYTLTVVRGARVVRADAAGGPLGDGGSLVVTLSVRGHEEARAVSHSAAAADVSIVRSGGDQAAGDTYRTPPPSED